MTKQPTFAAILEDAKHVNRAADSGDDSTKTMAVLMASVIVGADIDKLETYTGYDRGFLEMIDSQCRKNGIWVGDKVHADWFDPENGGISLLMDSAVACGLLERARPTRANPRGKKIAQPT